MSKLDKIVIVTRKTPLQGLIERFNTRAQAKFYVEHSGGAFEPYVAEDEIWRRTQDEVQRALDFGLRLHTVDRALVPTMIFSAADLIVTVGPNGLVANTAKYVGRQPIVAINPDPRLHEPILTPFAAAQARATVERVLAGHAAFREVTLAEARTNDGQRLLAFNDLYIGARTHVSARYALDWEGRREDQSSSGMIVSTGAGSTGWLSSVFNMANGILRFGTDGKKPPRVDAVRMAWDDPRLMFVVREPFASRHSRADIVAGVLDAGHALRIESLMPSGGVIFSDGVEDDFISFTSGVHATIGAAPERARLVAA